MGRILRWTWRMGWRMGMVDATPSDVAPANQHAATHSSDLCTSQAGNTSTLGGMACRRRRTCPLLVTTWLGSSSSSDSIIAFTSVLCGSVHLHLGSHPARSQSHQHDRFQCHAYTFAFASCMSSLTCIVIAKRETFGIESMHCPVLDCQANDTQTQSRTRNQQQCTRRYSIAASVLIDKRRCRHRMHWPPSRTLHRAEAINRQQIRTPRRH